MSWWFIGSEAFSLTDKNSYVLRWLGCVGDVLPWMIWGVRTNSVLWNAWRPQWDSWGLGNKPMTLPLCAIGHGAGWLTLGRERGNVDQLRAVLCLNDSSSISRSDSSSLKLQREDNSTGCRSECRSYGVIGVGVVNSYGSVQRSKWLVAMGTCHKNLQWLMEVFFFCFVF